MLFKASENAPNYQTIVPVSLLKYSPVFLVLFPVLRVPAQLVAVVPVPVLGSVRPAAAAAVPVARPRPSLFAALFVTALVASVAAATGLLPLAAARSATMLAIPETSN